jgi:26S proteasome regulatory subunit N10
MVLEASFLCIDNSDYMRNGDHAPSRMEAQLDAVNLLSGAKTQSNPENVVGLLSTAGRGVEVQVALTGDVGQVLSLSHGIKIGGNANLSAGIQVAQLSLKHRQNKNQRQRIIVFVGSPVQEEEAALVKLGKKLKKNSVAMDIINFGEEAPRAADTVERRKGGEGPRRAADKHREEGSRGEPRGAAGNARTRERRPPRAPAGGERRQARGAAQRRQL